MQKIKTLCAVHRVIKSKMKGSIDEIAQQTGVSRKCFYNYLDELRNYGAEMSYSRTAQCYSYNTPFELKFEIGPTGMTQVLGGGKKINFFPYPKNTRKGFMFGSSNENDNLHL